MDIEIIRHSLSHIMASAVKNLYGDVKFAIGPAIANGFYYDFDLPETISLDDLAKIEGEMKRFINSGLNFERKEISKEEALKLFADQPYKKELIEELDDGQISIYQVGDFVDLCKGPHIASTADLKDCAFKLVSVNGAYWRGSEKNKMLQRIYAYAFENKKALGEYMEMLEQAKARDHKKLGKELGLFMISEYGPGFPFFLNKGMLLRNTLENFWYSEHAKEGYEFIKTPIMLNKELWELSGHWKNYRENMYTSEIDERTFAIKPMNCPGGMLVYKNGMHSYKDLPLRVGELGQVHRHEASGTLNGLFRVRTFTQDDAHIFMTEDQIEEEVVRLINFIDRMYKVFGLSYDIELSTRPEEKYIGDIAIWDKSEKALEEACKKAGHTCKINPGDGAFYGPKLDFHVKDSIGRVWQCGTIQLDMNLPERFDLTYVDKDNTKKRPVMLHRVIYGSIERFIGILIEHYAGAFPFWLAPIQVGIVPVKEEFNDYAALVKEELAKVGIRAEVNLADDGMGAKVFGYKKAKVPYAVVVGGREQENQSVSVKTRDGVQMNGLTIAQFVELCQKQNEEKSIQLIDKI